jgi:hypothetical protein
MLLCWNPGKCSPIHDHPCRGCWVRVCEGEVVETRYQKDEATGALVETERNSFACPGVTYMHGKWKGRCFLWLGSLVRAQTRWAFTRLAAPTLASERAPSTCTPRRTSLAVSGSTRRTRARCAGLW